MPTDISDKETQNTPVQSVDFDNLQEQKGKTLADTKVNLELVRNVQVELEVILGQTNLTVAQIMDLKNGEVVEINRNASDPIDLVLDGKIVAQGHLVAVGENFGLQIVEPS